jgi:hypothetical protein
MFGAATKNRSAYLFSNAARQFKTTVTGSETAFDFPIRNRLQRGPYLRSIRRDGEPAGETRFRRCRVVTPCRMYVNFCADK